MPFISFLLFLDFFENLSLSVDIPLAVRVSLLVCNQKGDCSQLHAVKPRLNHCKARKIRGDQRAKARIRPSKAHASNKQETELVVCLFQPWP
jgi:hypothetical protein